jgi:hypothetical protein
VLLLVVVQLAALLGWAPPATATTPCPSGEPAAGLTNAGFETGDLTGWTGDPSTAVVTGADGFTAPLEGSSMLRLGTPAPDADQPQGAERAVLCQELVVDQPVLDLAVALFTYDQSGFDRFELRLSTVDPVGTVAVYEQRAWGAAGDVDRKTSGWVGARFDLSDHLGEVVRLELAVEGTDDDRYASWAYLDSAAGGLPVPPVTVRSTASALGTAVIDPVGGAVAVTQPAGSPGDLTLVTDVSCPGGGVPTEVELSVGLVRVPMLEAVRGSGTWVGTLTGDTDPAGGIPAGVLTVGARCPGASLQQAIGEVRLADSPPTFTDVPVGHPFWLDITWAGFRGVASGYADGSFRPGAAVTRQAWAAFSTRLGDPQPTVAPCATAPYADVASTHPFCGEIAGITDAGLMDGYADGTFRPDRTMTREAVAAVLYRMAGAPEGADPACTARPFPDVPVASPFCGEVAWVAADGLADGFADGTFRPSATVTRQAAAAFLLRFTQRS